MLIENGKIVDCSDSAIKMLLADNKNEIINKHPAELSPVYQDDGVNSFEKAQEMIQLCYSNGNHSFDWIHQRFNGENFWVEVVLTLLSFEDREIVHVAWRDISNRKALESSLHTKSLLYKKLNEELDQKVKQQSAYLMQQSRLAQMGEMISMIAHQWRQPLASISAISGTLSLEIILDQFNKKNHLEQLNSISDITHHLSSTIDVFRGFFQEDKVLETISIENIVNSCLEIIGPILKSQSINLVCDYDEDYHVALSPNGFKQVVINLLKNAEDILTEKKIHNPNIWIKSYAKDSIVNLCIEDNAGGISEDIIGNIFDPYFTTKSSNGGTGLGLYMSKTIIEEHCRGSLNVENTSNGAKFTILLPLAKNYK